MTNESRRTPGLESSLKNLTISTPARPKTATPIADTWDAAASPSPPSTTTNSPSAPSTPTDASPGPPPPTPISPTSSHARKKSTDWSTFASAYSGPSASGTPRSPAGLEKRPEKSSAAAGRLIAGALGVKAPKASEEGRAYERAVRERERKKREVAREEAGRAEREKEEARRAVWEG